MIELAPGPGYALGIGGADGTPFCMRWTYANSESWASAHLPLGGPHRPPGGGRLSRGERLKTSPPAPLFMTRDE